MKQKTILIIIFFFLGLVAGYLLNAMTQRSLPFLQLSDREPRRDRQVEEVYEIRGAVIEVSDSSLVMEAGEDPCYGPMQKTVTINDETVILQQKEKTESDWYNEETLEELESLENQLKNAETREEAREFAEQINSLKDQAMDEQAAKAKADYQAKAGQGNKRSEILSKYELLDKTSNYRYLEADVDSIKKDYLLEVHSQENINADDKFEAEVIIIITDIN